MTASRKNHRKDQPASHLLGDLKRQWAARPKCLAHGRPAPCDDCITGATEDGDRG